MKHIDLPTWFMCSLIIFVNAVSESDIFLLYERFQQLKPDSNGFIDRIIFEVDDYSDPFCRQVSELLIHKDFDWQCH